MTRWIVLAALVAARVSAGPVEELRAFEDRYSVRVIAPLDIDWLPADLTGEAAQDWIFDHTRLRMADVLRMARPTGRRSDGTLGPTDPDRYQSAFYAALTPAQRQALASGVPLVIDQLAPGAIDAFSAHLANLAWRGALLSYLPPSGAELDERGRIDINGRRYGDEEWAARLQRQDRLHRYYQELRHYPWRLAIGLALHCEPALRDEEGERGLGRVESMGDENLAEGVAWRAAADGTLRRVDDGRDQDVMRDEASARFWSLPADHGMVTILESRAYTLAEIAALVSVYVPCTAVERVAAERLYVSAGKSHANDLLHDAAYANGCMVRRLADRFEIDLLPPPPEVDGLVLPDDLASGLWLRAEAFDWPFTLGELTGPDGWPRQVRFADLPAKQQVWLLTHTQWDYTPALRGGGMVMLATHQQPTSRVGRGSVEFQLSLRTAVLGLYDSPDDDSDALALQRLTGLSTLPPMR